MKKCFKYLRKCCGKRFILLQLLIGVLLQLFGVQLVFSSVNDTSAHFNEIHADENSVGHMNINIISIEIEGVALETNDEIGIFNCGRCVGVAKVYSTDKDSLIGIVCSEDDGSGNGYIENDTIIIKVWDESEQQEMSYSIIKYWDLVPVWDTDGLFSSGETAFIEVSFKRPKHQIINLISGVNLISSYLKPAEDKIFTDVLKSEINDDNLKYIFNENGHEIYNYMSSNDGISDPDAIMDIESYFVIVEDSCTVLLSGYDRDDDVIYELNEGVNYIAYPFNKPSDPILFFDALIDENKLKLVMDAKGNTFEFWDSQNKWINSINYLQPGQGYVVVMDTTTEFLVNPDISLDMYENQNFQKDLSHYDPCYSGNGYGHMVIHITNIADMGFQEGDELALFDGDLCVGAIKITKAQLADGIASIPASMEFNKNYNGFIEGDTITIRIWQPSMQTEQELIVNSFHDLVFQKYRSIFTEVKHGRITSGYRLNTDIKIELYPNPVKDKLYINFGSNIENQENLINIFNISGEIVLNNVFLNQNSIDVSSLSSGIYFIKLEFNYRSDIFPFIKQ